MFKVEKRKLWESAGSIARFGQLKFTGKALAWKASRIHKAATAVLEKMTEENNAAVENFGEPVERQDMAGNKFTRFEVAATGEDRKGYKAALDEILNGTVEIWGDPFTIEELPVEFWGQDEEKNAEGKIIKPKIAAMMDLQDIGALGEWVIADGEPENRGSDEMAMGASA